MVKQTRCVSDLPRATSSLSSDGGDGGHGCNITCVGPPPWRALLHAAAVCGDLHEDIDKANDVTGTVGHHLDKPP